MKTWLKVVLGIVVCLVCLLVWIFHDFECGKLNRHGTCQTTIGNLGALRAAIEMYRENEERLPEDLSELAVDGKYIREIPTAKTCWHKPSKEVHAMTSEEYEAGEFGDTGGWAYVVSGSSAGIVTVDCTHTDTRLKTWASY